MGATGPNHASGNVPDPGASAGTTHFLKEKSYIQTAVTSVALTAPSIFTVAGSPITTSGTLALSLTLQSSKHSIRGNRLQAQQLLLPSGTCHRWLTAGTER